MEEITLVAAVIAVTQFAKQAFPKISGWVTIVFAAALGLLAGYTGLEGLTPMTGLLAGLAAVGTHTIVSRISAK